MSEAVKNKGFGRCNVVRKDQAGQIFNIHDADLVGLVIEEFACGFIGQRFCILRHQEGAHVQLFLLVDEANNLEKSGGDQRGAPALRGDRAGGGQTKLGR